MVISPAQLMVANSKTTKVKSKCIWGLYADGVVNWTRRGDDKIIYQELTDAWFGLPYN